MNKFKKFMYKYISGGASIKIGKEKYLNYPKTANFMVPGLAIAGLSWETGDFLPVVGLILIVIGLFSFFYPEFHPLKFSELDDDGKLFYVETVGMENLTDEEKKEYFDIKNKKAS